MVRKCKGTAEVAVMDVAAVGVRTRARAVVAATASSAGAAKRRRIGSDASNSESFKLSSNNSTCTQLRSSAGRRNSAVLPQAPITLTEEFRCLSTSSDDQASVSCCSSYGSSEMEKDKLRFADLEEEHSEADSSTSRFSRERREKTPSSEAGGGGGGEEETDSMNSSLDKAPELNPLERSKGEIQSAVVDKEPEGQFKKAGKPEIKMPTQFEIEEFFAAAEAENLRELEHYRKKYNFDFVKEEPLEGRFEWHKIAPAEELIK